ncbi:hypothetical protein [Nisaea nitritireducens]|uniref:hypothetical protein n=1 Tax=Nisaea nitritireducens TaxID=568392 RepID=UPI001867580F|nr:hypothetical protein [Nisaea nitritireducens]
MRATHSLWAGTDKQTGCEFLMLTGIVSAVAVAAFLASGNGADIFSGDFGNLCFALALTAAAVDIRRSVQTHGPASITWLDWGVFVLVLVLVAAPTLSSNWFALLLCGFWSFGKGDRFKRYAGIMLIGTSVYLLKDSVWAGFVAQAVLDLEAWAIASIHDLVAGPALARGNVVSLADGRTLVILRDCSVLNLVAPAVLSVMALRRLLHESRTGIWPFVAAISLFVLVLNTIRLTGMAYSPELYDVLHNGVGEDIFASLVSVAVGLLSIWKKAR